MKSLFSTLVLFVLLSTVFHGCKSGQQGGPTANNTAFNDDLSPYRITFEATEIDSSAILEANTQLDPNAIPSGNINSSLDDMIKKMSTRDLGSVQGYRIMVYSGTDRYKAEQIIQEIRDEMQIYDIYLQYQQPNYKVKVGNYYTKLSANNTFTALRNKYSMTILLPEKIRIKKVIQEQDSILQSMDSALDTMDVEKR